MLSFVSTLLAQSPATTAPIPQQVLTARKVFVSNAGEVRDPNGDLDFKGGPDRAYDQFYAAIQTWGKYELAPAPTDADLVLEIRVDRVPGSFYQQLHLAIVDPKTHTILWTFVEHASPSGRQKKSDAAFDRAMGLIVGDLKKLITQSSSAGEVPAK
jgi:hypothetical protein